jgi:hypothetical protein
MDLSDKRILALWRRWRDKRRRIAKNRAKAKLHAELVRIRTELHGGGCNGVDPAYMRRTAAALNIIARTGPDAMCREMAKLMLNRMGYTGEDDDTTRDIPCKQSSEK